MWDKLPRASEGHFTEKDEYIIQEVLDRINIAYRDNIVEIGFNAGHSAYMWLHNSANMDTHLTSIDIGRHNYTREGVTLIKKEYNDRFNYIECDSLEAGLYLQKYIIVNDQLTNNIINYKLFSIDGSHDRLHIINDIQLAYFYNTKYILLDDYSGIVREITQKMIPKTCLEEVYTNTEAVKALYRLK